MIEDESLLPLSKTASGDVPLVVAIVRTVPNELVWERCDRVDAESVLRCLGSDVFSFRGSASAALRLLPIAGFAPVATTERFAETPLEAVERPLSRALLAGGFLSPSLDVFDSWLANVSCCLLRTPFT
jgi:hypothetical protein